MERPDWNIETVDATSNEVGWYTSIAVASNNKPHIAYYDFTNNDLKYAYLSNSGWNIEVVDTNAGDSASLAIDSNDNPHISYTQFKNNNDLGYAVKEGTSWSIETVDSQGNVGQYPF